MSDETPPQDGKITAPLAAVPEWAAELTISVKSGFARQEARFDGLEERMVKVETNGDTNGQMLQNLQQRMTLAEQRLDRQESRSTTHSERTKDLASVNTTQDGRLDRFEKKLDENTTKTEQMLAIGQRLDKVAEHPMVRRVAYAIGLALLAWLTAHAKGVM